ncbi:polyprenyl synthetase family protein [Candidatus Uhrbacteria bacterium]|nr:polyprenyl synthetase family protein [Candidatus Uhrbacteria bacterium]
MDIQAFKKRFDPVLMKFLDRKIRLYVKHTSDPFILEMIGYASKLLLASGKRVRPYMAAMTYKASGGRSDAKALPVFAGLELFHAFALVHDDIMDRGEERHGIPTAHRYVERRLKEQGRTGSAAHLGEAQAILIGDLLFSWANETLAGTKAYPIFIRMIDEVLTGQMIDVDVMTRRSVDDGLIMDKMRLKTATYTFVRPMQIGAVLAGANGKMAKFCEAYGLPLGLAFQIQDDMLDMITPAHVHGKTAFSDLRDGQHTLFTQYIFSHGTASEIRQLRSMMGASLSERDRPRVIAFFESTGSLEYGRTVMNAYFDEAEQALVKMNFPKRKAQPFSDLIQYIRKRAS